MKRFFIKLFARGKFHEFSKVHDGDSCRKVLHKCQVMRNEKIGESHVFLQLFEQVDDLRLNGHVQSRHGLVADHQFWVIDHRPRDADALVLAPRFSPTGDRVLYTSYESGFPRINVLDVASVGRRELPTAEGSMSFTPRFSRDGRQVIYSLASGGNTDIWRTDLATGAHMRLTSAPSIETAPSLSPDGSQIVFESDRSGNQQLYIMSANGGEPVRISFGEGRYGSPVWSPRGDLIAFTKQNAGRFHIGVMRTDGSEERLLTASFLDEGPSWSPNGRVLMFTRETQGASGGPSLYTVDISGRNLRQLPVNGFASDPSWGPLQR